jgi:hypothetical protein
VHPRHPCLTPLRDTGAAQATGVRPLVPRVTTQEAYPSFRVEFFSLDFRGHRVVRRGRSYPRPDTPTNLTNDLRMGQFAY